MYLPRAAEQKDPETTVITKRSVVKSEGELILVVEDDLRVR